MSDRQVVVFSQDFVDGKVGLDVLGTVRVAGIVLAKSSERFCGWSFFFYHSVVRYLRFVNPTHQLDLCSHGG